MGINRQQFNKYLSGASFPSPRTLARMADFFGCDVKELQLPHREFVRLRKIGKSSLNRAMQEIGFIHGTSTEAGNGLEKYCGLFQTYHHVPGPKKSIAVGFCAIRAVGGRTLSTFLEPSVFDDTGPSTRKLARMQGSVTLDGGFLYILDHRHDANSSYSLTILYESRSEAPNLLTGMTLSISRHLNGLPYAANIVYERLNAETDIRSALRRLGQYDEGSPLVRDPIRHVIFNDIRPGECTLSHRFL